MQRPLSQATLRHTPSLTMQSLDFPHALAWLPA
jgi:hypothetical protein